MNVPANPYVTSELSKTERLQSILTKYEITIAEANDLVALEGYDIVFILDDSGSMTLSSEPVSQRKLGQKSKTRWEELGETVKLVAELACVFDDDGIDLHFLNRPTLKGIKSGDDPTLLAALSSGPRGGTPLTETVERVVRDLESSEKPVLLMIATDGEPSGGPVKFMRLISDVILRKPSFKFQILACTADEASVSWLDTFDKQFAAVDVTDDYYSERDQILKAGKVSKFSRADWVMKALLGPICAKFDDLDEPAHKVPPYQHRAPPKNQTKSDPCCIVL